MEDERPLIQRAEENLSRKLAKKIEGYKRFYGDRGVPVPKSTQAAMDKLQFRIDCISKRYAVNDG